MSNEEMRKLIESIGSIEVFEDKDEVARLIEIKDQMKELMDETRSIIEHQEDSITWERAKRYWYGHIVSALDDDHMYVSGGHSPTMQDTIDEMGGGGMKQAVEMVEQYMNDTGASVEEAVNEVSGDYDVDANELMAAVREVMEPGMG